MLDFNIPQANSPGEPQIDTKGAVLIKEALEEFLDNIRNAPDEPLKNAEDYVLMIDPLEEFQVASEFPVLPRWIKSGIITSERF